MFCVGGGGEIVCEGMRVGMGCVCVCIAVWVFGVVYWKLTKQTFY